MALREKQFILFLKNNDAKLGAFFSSYLNQCFIIFYIPFHIMKFCEFEHFHKTKLRYFS